MVEENNAVTGTATEASSSMRQINVRVQPGENSGIPIYSNFSTVQGGKGTIIVDFGFVEPNAINAMNRAIKSGEKPPEALSGKLSCRMALNAEAAQQLSQQLSQLLRLNIPPVASTASENTRDSNLDANKETESVDEKPEDQIDQKTDGGGFRFPWSKKK